MRPSAGARHHAGDSRPPRSGGPARRTAAQGIEHPETAASEEGTRKRPGHWRAQGMPAIHGDHGVPPSSSMAGRDRAPRAALEPSPASMKKASDGESARRRTSEKVANGVCHQALKDPAPRGHNRAATARQTRPWLGAERRGEGSQAVGGGDPPSVVRWWSGRGSESELSSSCPRGLGDLCSRGGVAADAAVANSGRRGRPSPAGRDLPARPPGSGGSRPSSGRSGS